MAVIRGCYRLLVLAVALMFFVTGCSFARGLRDRADEGHQFVVDESLRPQLDRFQIALSAHATGQRLDPNSTEMKLFTAALVTTVKEYVDPTDPAKLVDAAIAGLDRSGSTTNPIDVGSLVDAGLTEMVSSLDQHSAYLAREMYQELNVDTRGQFGGVGLEITTRNGVITIVSPIEDGPAARAGIRPGDQLLAIGDVATTGINLVDAIHRLRGPSGTKVILKIGRADVPQPLSLILTREAIHIQSVRFSRINERYGYIRNSQFQEGTESDLDDALESLQRTGSFDGLVLDLRNNPGGRLAAAIRIAQLFLGSGVVVSTKGRTTDQSHTYYANGGAGKWHKIPVIILVNHGTAAGSELVAAAIQANERGQLVGSHTFGSGTVQTIFPIGNQAALRLTTARMYGPNGDALGLGLQPDIPTDPDSWSTNVPSVKDSIVAEAVRCLAGQNVQ